MKKSKKLLILISSLILSGIVAGIFYFPSIQNYLDKESEKRISRLENITPIGIFTPEQVLENEKTLDGKKIAIKGEIKWISYPPRGKLPMPGMGGLRPEANIGRSARQR